MAVSEQTPYIEYTANGTTTSFALNFDCESKDHLIVLVDDVEPAVGSWSLTGGAVIFGTAPEDGKKITIQRNTPFSRNTDYQSYNNSFRPHSVNGDFDRVWLKLQELGVTNWLLRLYIDRLHGEQKTYIDQKDTQLQNNINSLSTHVDQQDAQLQQNIDNLKTYVDDKDNELRAYLMEEIRKQGVALDQLDDYYNYLMQRLAQIAVQGGWEASFVVSAGGDNQQEINDRGGSYWREKPLGYDINSRVMLENGDIVKSTVPNNTVDPNVDMTGWSNPYAEQKKINDYVVDVDQFEKFIIDGDWNNAFDKAFDKVIAKGGGTVVFNPREYVLKTPFKKEIPNNIKINIIGYGATINATSIKGGAAGDTVIFSIGGYIMTDSQLGSDVASMSSSISLASNMSLKKGDILKIISTDLFEPSRAYYYKGEFVQVVSATAGSAVIAGATYDSYAAATTRAEKLAMPSVSVEGIDIKCDSNQTGLELIYCRNPSAYRVTVNGARYTGIRFYCCIGGDATKNNISDSWYSGTSTSYNIAVTSCQDFTVQNNHLREARHNIASGGTIPCRNIKYLYNDCLTHPSNGNFAAIDAHSNGEYFQIIGNNCESIVVSARHIKIRDNVIRSTKPDYQCLAIQAYLNDGRYELENNDVKATGVNSTTFYFAAVVPNVVTELLKISGGNLESTSASILLRPRVTTAVGNIIKDLKVVDVSAAGLVVDHLGVATLNIQNMSTTRLKSHTGITGNALFISQDSVVEKFTSTEDTYQRNYLNASIGKITAKKVTMTLPAIKGESPTLKSRGLEFNSCENVKVANPTIENCTVAIELTGSAGIYIESGRTVSNSVKTILNAAGSTIAESETRNGNLILSATAIPTVGSYTVGDYIRNTANTIITGTPNKRLIGWYRATTGTSHALGTDWIAEYAVLA